MTDADEFLSWIQTSLYSAELALHDGDAEPRRALWSRNEPVSVLGAWRNAYGQEEVDALFASLARTFSDCTSYSFELQSYDVVLLAEMPLTAAQVTLLTDWVNGGGNLVAMRPDPQLAPLLGLAAAGAPLDEGYLLADTSAAPGRGIVAQTIQYHGAADRYTTAGAVTVAMLVSTPSAPGSIVPVTSKVAVPAPAQVPGAPASSETAAAMSPTPAAGQLLPALAAQVQVAPR